MATKLTLDDIADLRAYERARLEFRQHIIQLKKRRRVGIGPLATLLFENRDTVRFQIQEMARAERMLSDEQIQTELDIYNPLIPGPAELSATLFIELTDDAQLREWLPKLVGIERAVLLRLSDGGGAETIRGVVEEQHRSQLTREDVTAAVHYVRFPLSPAQVDSLGRAESVGVGMDHPHYRYVTPISDETRAALLGDLRRS